MWVVVKVSGKLVEDKSTFRGVVEALKTIVGDGYRVAVVVGGGLLARRLVEFASEFTHNKSLLDMLGIEASRVYARLIATALGVPSVTRSLDEALLEAHRGSRVIVSGGLQPGQSTTTVAALLAEALSARRLVLATIVDGIFDKDPAKHPDAKLIPELSYRQALNVISSGVEPGRYEMIDPYAAAILERAGIETYVVNGRHPDRIVAAARGERVKGTIVKPEPPRKQHI